MSSNYTFSKLLDFNRSNSKKKKLINANILIKISLITLYLLYSIPISKPKKTQKSIHLSLIFFPLFLKKKFLHCTSLCLSISFSFIALPPPRPGHR